MQTNSSSRYKAMWIIHNLQHFQWHKTDYRQIYFPSLISSNYQDWKLKYIFLKTATHAWLSVQLNKPELSEHQWGLQSLLKTQKTLSILRASDHSCKRQNQMSNSHNVFIFQQNLSSFIYYACHHNGLYLFHMQNNLEVSFTSPEAFQVDLMRVDSWWYEFDFVHNRFTGDNSYLTSNLYVLMSVHDMLVSKWHKMTLQWRLCVYIPT